MQALTDMDNMPFFIYFSVTLLVYSKASGWKGSWWTQRASPEQMLMFTRSGQQETVSHVSGSQCFLREQHTLAVSVIQSLVAHIGWCLVIVDKRPSY